MNLFLIASGGRALTFGEVVLLSVSGTLLVLLALTILALSVSLFKFFGKKTEKPPKADNPGTAAVPPATENPPPNTPQLDDNQLAAVLAAVSIELKLYHEDELPQLTFDYTPRQISGWSMANHSTN
ncbi:MAG TPA: hypothetical protein ENN07_08620 [candidate division Zixibacteria bacterium]|nr:hypothetical protein [candidate division Zixibacteria bacterium]